MTTTSHQPEHGHLLEDAVTETVARLDGLDALSGYPTAAVLAAPASDPAWNCLEHVPAASFASFVAECLRFGGRRRRQEAAKAAYDARWAGHGIGERGDEPWFAPEVAIEIAPGLRQPRWVPTRGGRVA
jgi:hypothetical protein